MRTNWNKWTISCKSTLPVPSLLKNTAILLCCSLYLSSSGNLWLFRWFNPFVSFVSLFIPLYDLIPFCKIYLILWKKWLFHIITIIVKYIYIFYNHTHAGYVIPSDQRTVCSLIWGHTWLLMNFRTFVPGYLVLIVRKNLKLKIRAVR